MGSRCQLSRAGWRLERNDGSLLPRDRMGMSAARDLRTTCEFKPHHGIPTCEQAFEHLLGVTAGLKSFSGKMIDTGIFLKPSEVAFDGIFPGTMPNPGLCRMLLPRPQVAPVCELMIRHSLLRTERSSLQDEKTTSCFAA